MPRGKKTAEKLIKNPEEIRFKELKPRKKRRKRVEKENHRPGYLFSIFINGLFLYGLNNFSFQGIPFLTLSFQKVLPVINVCLGVSIFGSFLLILDDEGKFGSFLKITQNLFSLYLVYSFYKIFPFNFASISNAGLITPVLKIALLAIIVGLGVASILEFVKLAFEK